MLYIDIQNRLTNVWILDRVMISWGKYFWELKEEVWNVAKCSVLEKKNHTMWSLPMAHSFLYPRVTKVSSMMAFQFAVGSSSENVINGLNVCKAFQISFIWISLIISRYYCHCIGFHMMKFKSTL